MVLNDARMRTTVTLDSDVEVMLTEMMRDHQLSFEEALNRAVRAGIRAATGTERLATYTLKTKDLGLRADKMPSDLLAELDPEEDCKEFR